MWKKGSLYADLFLLKLLSEKARDYGFVFDK